MPYSFEDLASSAGTVTGNFFKDAANAVANTTCLFYKNFPGAFVGLPDPTGVGAFSRGIWDTLCANRAPGLPPAPSSPFGGGQCLGVVYAITFRYNLSNGSFVDATEIGFYGSVDRTSFRLVQSYSNGDTAWVATVTCRGLSYSGGGVSPTPIVVDARPDGWLRIPSGVSVTSCPVVGIVRQDGQPDICGDPPPTYPVPPPNSIPSVIVVNVPRPAGDIATFNLTAPVFLNTVPIVFNFGLTIPVDFSLVFDFDGATFNIGGGGGEGDTYTYPDWFPRFFTPPNPDNDPDVDKTDYPVIVNPPQQKGKEGLKWVRVTLVDLPDKSQFAPSGNSVYFGGWITFLKGNDSLPRQQINFVNSLFRAPDGADGYEVVYTNGAIGKISEYTEKEGV